MKLSTRLYITKLNISITKLYMILYIIQKKVIMICLKFAITVDLKHSLEAKLEITLKKIMKMAVFSTV